MKSILTAFFIVASFLIYRDDLSLNSVPSSGRSNKLWTYESNYPIDKNLDLKKFSLNREFYEKFRDNIVTDPEIIYLIEKLKTFQNSADNLSINSKDSNSLKDITEKIGELKGVIEYRTLRLYYEI